MFVFVYNLGKHVSQWLQFTDYLLIFASYWSFSLEKMKQRIMKKREKKRKKNIPKKHTPFTSSNQKEQ